MAEHFTEREISCFYESFRHYDTHMEGSIPVKDVRPALLALGQIPSDKELNNLIDLIDNEVSSPGHFGSEDVSDSSDMTENFEQLSDLLPAVLQTLQEEGTGRIDFHGLLTILALKLKHPDTEEHLRLAFKIFDKDGNGNVSAAELKDAMATLGGDVTQDDIDQMITLADTDGDGQVNYEEFIQVIMSH